MRSFFGRLFLVLCLFCLSLKGFVAIAQAQEGYSNTDLLWHDLTSFNSIGSFFSNGESQVLGRDPVTGRATSFETQEQIDARVAAERGAAARGAAASAAGTLGASAQTQAAIRGNQPTGTGTITDLLTAKLLGFIAFMMGLIVSFLGKVILLLVNVLLGFLSYNGFADAPPVIIGWKIVRDLANMFFIIVLIVSSYATILGWRRNEMHVVEVLKKLLVAAVLVNFSKTIVSLLIDASQVVMLTFVNAFASIGAGNFTNALHLPLISESNYSSTLEGMVSSTAQSVVTNGAGQVILDVLLASALQIFLLVVAIGVMLMMVIFVVARIVGLWMLLIFSPLPFLANALPSTMSKVLGKQVNDFWGQLSGLLTGGPIMAFWLWLTFATLSAQGANERLGLFQNTQATDLGNAFNMTQNATSMFITAIGNAQGLGSYLIAVAMMLMGLEAAISAAGAVGSTAGGWMKTIGNKSRSYAQRAALFAAGGGALAAGALALRGGRAVGGAVGGAALGAFERRYDARGKVAGWARRVVPFAGQNKWLREQQFKNRKDWEARAKEMSGALDNKYATKAEKEAQRKINQGAFGWRRYDRAVGMADKMELAKITGDAKGYDGDFKDMKDAAKAAVKGKTDDVVAKRVSDRLAKQQAITQRLADFERQKSMIVGTTQAADEERDKIDDAMKKLRKENLHLLQDDTERGKQLKEVRQNWSSLDADAKSNFDVLRSVASADAFKEVNGRVVIGDENAIRETSRRLQGRDRSNFDAMVKHIRESGEIDSTGKVVAAGLEIGRFRNMSIEQDANLKDRVFEVSADAKGVVNVGDTGFQKSDRQQYAIQSVRTDLAADTSGRWISSHTPTGAPTVDVADGRGDRLIQSVQTGGIRQTIENVGGKVGADGTWSADPKDAQTQRAREAVLNHVSSYVQGQLASATASMDAVVPDYTDSTGAVITGKKRSDVLRDSKAPDSVKDKATADYLNTIREVMPVLRGVEDLDADQQVALMGAMGRGGVATSLNDKLMDEDQRQIMGKVREMARNNSAKVETWFSEQNRTPEGRAELAEMQVLEGQSDGDRNALLSGDEALRHRYETYNNYKNARNAIAQLARSGKSAQARERKSPGGGGPRPPRPAPPTPPTPPAPPAGGGGGGPTT